MRSPRILTCSSARPRYRSCPSAPQHTKSPVLYILCPGPPKGQATNRDPVNPDRRQYPHPSPAPATYNSPTTPAGTGRNHPSSTNNAAPGTPEPTGTALPPAPARNPPSSPNRSAPGTGDPIGTAPAPAVSGALSITTMVVSVGP